MSERKINLDDYVDDLPLAVASYRNKLKIVMKELIKETLELAAENAETTHIGSGMYLVDKESILNTINQIE